MIVWLGIGSSETVACVLHHCGRQCITRGNRSCGSAAEVMESVRVKAGCATATCGTGIRLDGGITTLSSSQWQMISAKRNPGSPQQSLGSARLYLSQAGRKHMAGASEKFAKPARYPVEEQQLWSCYTANDWHQWPRSGTGAVAVAAYQRNDALPNSEPSTSSKAADESSRGLGAPRTSEDDTIQAIVPAEQGHSSYNGRAVRQFSELSDSKSQVPTDVGPGTLRRPKSPRRQSVARSKITKYLQRRAGYAWLAAPLLATASAALPIFLVPLPELLASSYLVGLAATLATDLLFVLSADIFLVLANRTGHHQAVPGGPAPWTGPWEYTGYPQGLPHLQKYLSYAGVGLASSAIVVSLLLGPRKFSVALAVFVPYLSLVFAQLAYERVVYSDRLPVFPLVAILYTAYRFRQLVRGLDVVGAMSGGLVLATTVKMLTVICTFYLAMHLTQLPWLYSTWNTQRAS